MMLGRLLQLCLVVVPSVNMVHAAQDVREAILSPISFGMSEAELRASYSRANALVE